MNISVKSAFSTSFSTFIFISLAVFALSDIGIAQSEVDYGPPLVLRSVKSDVSPPLADITPRLSTKFKKAEDEVGNIPLGLERHDADPKVQSSIGLGVFSGLELIPGPSANFAGMTNTMGITPPDPNGEVGPNHYIQMVNSRFQMP